MMEPVKTRDELEKLNSEKLTVKIYLYGEAEELKDAVLILQRLQEMYDYVVPIWITDLDLLNMEERKLYGFDDNIVLCVVKNGKVSGKLNKEDANNTTKVMLAVTS